ncbi:uncharacterized protein [Leuresthes tenuis]|uniref:uncharacterized protein n=1 Tax=Leuresthes tenuis TaxID=355514 RepID=UPI003B511196
MASWGFASQLILISLLGWNVYCYPAKGWNQHNPDQGRSSMIVNASLPNAPYPAISPRPNKLADNKVSWVVARPQRKALPDKPLNPDGPAVSWLVDGLQKELPFPLNPEGSTNSWLTKPPKRGFPIPPSNPQGPSWMAYSSPQTLPDSFYSRDSWMVGKENPVVYTPASSSLLGAVPVAGPTSAQLESGNQVGPINVSPVHQRGDLPRFQGGLDQGNSNSETQQVLDSMIPLPFPPSIYKGGELLASSSLYEHGNFEHETEDDSPIPVPFAPGQVQGSFTAGSMPPGPSYGPVLPNMFYLFLTGQLPHGKVTHFQSDYESSKDHATEIGYDTYHSSTSGNVDPIQTQAPIDWQQGKGLAGF